MSEDVGIAPTAGPPAPPATHAAQRTGPRHAALRVPKAGPPAASWAPRTAIALGVAVGLGLLATASGASTARHTTPAATAATPPDSSKLITSLSQLSAGAPAGAKVLPAAPVHVTKPAPATPQVITGLAANGIPNVALNAYRVAAARMASAEPGCGIQWSLLAGIGRVESDHGQYGGSHLLPDGSDTPPIIGPALDGTKWDYITDTDGGRLDGDPRFDHAVGPMQFIPSTWAIWGTDADNNGIADPFDINDAALTAARYLCAAGGDLSTTDGQQRAILAYNHSDQYLAEVMAIAQAYAAGIPVSEPINGITSGPLPPPNGNGFVGPANPGPAYGSPDYGTAGASGAAGSHTAARHASPAKPKPAPARPASGSGTTGGSGTTPGTGSSAGSGAGGTAPSAPSAPQLPLPSVPPPSLPPPTVASPVVPAPVHSVVCTAVNALGVVVQIPCP